ncbi:MAG: hypothetical protein IPQ13_04460 [Holophagaceae bacterium]|nr:hypothetical protein [Holophagaceae bacterium]
MPRRPLYAPAALLFISGGLHAQAPQPDLALKEVFKQGKDLWANQGDRDGAAAKFEQVLAALEPMALQGSAMDPEWNQVLCETYNWLAILEDRNPAKKAEAVKRIEALVAFDPDFELDKNITSGKLQTLYENLRGAKFAKVGFTFQPDGGALKVDGKPGPASVSRYLPFGDHKLVYAKPGYSPQEVNLALAPKDAKNVDFKLDRNASTVTFYTYPSGTDVSLDGKPLGKTPVQPASAQAPAELKAVADKAGLKVEDLSGAFILSELRVGKHILELKSACFRPKRVELDESFTTPYADHVLEAIKLDPSRGTLTVGSAWPGGELFLSGQSYGPLPLNAASVCAGTYDLVVKYPSGGFSQRVEVPENKAVSLAAKPKPRLAFLGFDGMDEFPGKARLIAQLKSLGERLNEVAFIKPKEGEAPLEAMARLKTAKEAELVLTLTVVKDRPGFPVDLALGTLGGEEEHIAVKPLDEDPLLGLVGRLNAQPQIWEPSLGLVAADLPGEPGPVVINAGEAAKAGIQVLKPITQAGGKPVATALALRKVLFEAKGDSLPVIQAGLNASLPINREPLEIPHYAANLCYPFVLAELRLRTIAAKGDESAFLKLNQAIALMHFRRYDKALELLRDTKVSGAGRPPSALGLGQGTVDYYTGICLSRLGTVYIPEAIQAFGKAQNYSNSTLFGPDGPLVAPLAKQAAEDLKN